MFVERKFTRKLKTTLRRMLPLHFGLLQRLERERIARLHPVVPILSKLCDASGSFVDIGASHGTFSFYLGASARHVYAFEPIPLECDYLRARLAILKNSTVYECALSDHDEVGCLHIPSLKGKSSPGLASLTDNFTAQKLDIAERITVKVERLDSFQIPDAALIKIDTEGHELAVLRGAMETLRLHRPYLYVESEKRHNPNAPFDLFALLTREGYSCVFWLADRVYAQNQFDPGLHQSRPGVPDYVSDFLCYPLEKEGDVLARLQDCGHLIDEGLRS